jgi:hypothetical protein
MEEQRFGEFQNKVQKKTFGSKTGDITEKMKIL